MNTTGSSEIVFKKSQLSSLLQYIDLYQICFPKALHLNVPYLRWLYRDNPIGDFFGIDAYFDNRVIGQVAAIPGEYFLSGRVVKGLLAVNVAVHPKFQGRHLFKKLGLKMCELATEAGYSFVIGVANRVATLGWIRQMGFQLVQPLEARIGMGSLKVNFSIEMDEQFRRIWSDESFKWRAANPNNPIFKRYYYGRWECYAAAKGIYLPVYTELAKEIFSYAETKKRFLSPIRLFLGLLPFERKASLKNYYSIPNRYKPSPLNLIYKSLDQKVEKLEKEHITFSFLDFDAY